MVNPSLYPKLSYDPVKGFTPISGLVTINHALIVNPALPVENVKDLIALAKQKPGEINYGTFGVGSSGHLNMELFQALSGAKFQAVHYKGATPALTDVIAGHIQMMFISVGSAVPQWKSDKVKLIAVGAGKRMALLPEVPTVAESGLPGYEAVSWFGLFGPPGMPADIVTKINAEVRKVFADPEIKKNFLERQYFESIAGTPEAAHRLHQGRRAEVAQGDPGRQGQGGVDAARRSMAARRGQALLRRPSCASMRIARRSRSLHTGDLARDRRPKPQSRRRARDSLALFTMRLRRACPTSCVAGSGCA